jgi:hypothetical protein
LLIYEEKLPLPAWMQIVLFGGLTGIGFVNLTWPVFGDLGSARQYIAYYLTMTTVLALLAYAFASFRRLTIVISGDVIRFAFGVLRKSIALERIQSCEVRRYKWRTFGGWGIRFALGRRRAWSVPGVAGGVELTVVEGKRVRRYFVSSRSPELLAEAVRGR